VTGETNGGTIGGEGGLTAAGFAGFGRAIVVFCKIGGAIGSAPTASVLVGRVGFGREGCTGVALTLGARTTGLLVATTVGTGFNGAKAPGTGGSGVLLRTMTLVPGLVGLMAGKGLLGGVGSGADGGAICGSVDVFTVGTFVGSGAKGLTLRGALGRTAAAVAALEPLPGFPVGDVTGVVAKSGIC
jgi:hypothetical protein